MRRFRILTVANMKSYVRDRSTVFWTLVFPLVFVVFFGSIFSGGGSRLAIGWVDLDQTDASAQLAASPQIADVFTMIVGAEDEMLRSMREGRVSAVVIIPNGFEKAVGAAQGGVGSASPLPLTLYTDPSSQQQSQTITGVIGAAVAGINQAATGLSPVLALQLKTIQTEGIGAVQYIVPGILAMALMQLGLFSAIPLVEQRQNLILKRLAATPLRRWMFVGANLSTRVIVAVVQAVVLIAVAGILFGITVLGSWLVLAGLVLLGAMTFISLGYVVASFAPTEDAASQLVSVVQFPLMFLSGIFFSIDAMPGWLQAIARFMPLTYLGDALRQVMVGAVPFAPLAVDVAVLAGLTVVFFGISARYFRWQ
ncbi:MAG: ABC transporter permease [Chloroflexota bacterium]